LFLGEEATEIPPPQGWGSYLHRWSGLTWAHNNHSYHHGLRKRKRN